MLAAQYFKKLILILAIAPSNSSLFMYAVFNGIKPL